MSNPFDETKPPTGGNFVSAEHRQNYIALRNALAGMNLVRNAYARVWGKGVSAQAPSHFTRQGGAGSSCDREVSTVYGGIAQSISITGATAAAEYIEQDILPASKFPAYLQSTDFALACAVYGGAADSADIGIYDGVSDSWSSVVGNGFAANGSWTWLYLVKELSAAATQLTVRLRTAQGIESFFIAPTLLLGGTPANAPKDARSCRYIVQPGAMEGNLATKTRVNGWCDRASLPWVLERTLLTCETAPVSTAIVVKPKKGGVDVYSSFPEIAAAATDNGTGDEPSDVALASFDTDDILTADVTQVGTGTTGANLMISFEGECYEHPFCGIVPGVAWETGE